MKPYETKPFDLELAKAGHPVICRNGQGATITAFKKEHPFTDQDDGYQLSGYTGSDKADTTTWTVDGKFFVGKKVESEWDLFLKIVEAVPAKITVELGDNPALAVAATDRNGETVLTEIKPSSGHSFTEGMDDSEVMPGPVTFSEEPKIKPVLTRIREIRDRGNSEPLAVCEGDFKKNMTISPEQEMEEQIKLSRAAREVQDKLIDNIRAKERTIREREEAIKNGPHPVETCGCERCKQALIGEVMDMLHGEAKEEELKLYVVKASRETPGIGGISEETRTFRFIGTGLDDLTQQMEGYSDWEAQKIKIYRLD
jgi:hypothetical protein